MMTKSLLCSRLAAQSFVLSIALVVSALLMGCGASLVVSTRNSGNSSDPHLHFHVCDAPSALACNGVPFVFRSVVHLPTRYVGDSLEALHIESLGAPGQPASALPAEDEAVELR